ncbi:MAG: PLP-dependent aminotransferase family protein [Thermoanaerobaculia bacterium]
MPKRTTALPLVLPPGDASQPAYRQLADGLRTSILEGRLPPGTRIPATRDLANQLRLSRGTVVSAFELLQSQGYLEARVGAGTFVTETLPETLLQVPPSDEERTPALANREPCYSDFGKRIMPLKPSALRPPRPFRTNQPAPDLFPTTLWARVSNRRLRRTRPDLLLGCDPLGYPPLRRAIADYLRVSRGVRCTGEQVIVVSGVQEALDLVTRLLVNPGDRVCLEDPGYIGADRIFEAHGALITPIPVDGEGMEVPPTEYRNVRFAYTSPGHQFPLGMSMSLPRRLALLEWARTKGALLFEDDYDSEYRYAGRPLPALQGLDRHGSVLYAGSFSKVLSPALRLGYLVVPDGLLDVVSAIKSVISRYPPLLESAVLCDFISEGHFGRHLRQTREVYAARLAALRESARERLAGLLEVPPVDAGLQTVGWLAPGLDAEAAARAAAARDVEVTPVGRYSRLGMAREGLQLGFAAVDEREIRRGVRELAVALERTKT